MATAEQVLVYGGIVNHRFDERVLGLVKTLRHLPIDFSHVWHRSFADGEAGFRIEFPERIKDKHVIVFACIAQPRHELGLRDMVMAAKLQYGAATVTVVLPFLRYRRQDRPEKDYEINRLRWFIKCLRDWGTDNLVVCEPHSVANTQKFADEFGVKLFSADPTRLFADALRGAVQTVGAGKFRIYSPDFGSVGRALLLGKALGIVVIASPKRRGPDGEVQTLPQSDEFLALVRERYGADATLSCSLDEAKGLTVIMREDEVSTAGTAKKTSERLHELGIAGAWLVATHPVCSSGWKDNFWPHGKPAPFEKIWFGNTRVRGQDETRYEGSSGNRVTTVSMEPVLAEELLKVLDTLL